jgi:hypothetical protein
MDNIDRSQLSHNPGGRVAFSDFASNAQCESVSKVPPILEPFELSGVFVALSTAESAKLGLPVSSRQGTAVDRDNKKKAPGRMTADANNETGGPDGPRAGETVPGADDGMSPALQAHIGRHVRAMFDEVAKEPVPDHLLKLLKDLDQSGDK